MRYEIHHYIVSMRIQDDNYLDGLNAVEDPLRHTDADNVLLKTGVGLNGHDTGDDRAVDADGTTGLDPVKEHGHIKEELSDNEVSTSIHLLLDPPDLRALLDQLYNLGTSKLDLEMINVICSQ